MSNQMSPVPGPDEQTQQSAGVTHEDQTPRSWPTAIGVIGIVLACITLIGSTCGYIFTTEWFLNQMSDEMRAMMSQAKMSSTFMIISLIMGFVLGIWLLGGSIQLLRRNPGCRGVLNLWAITYLVWVVISTPWSLAESNEIRAAQSEQAQAETEQASESNAQPVQDAEEMRAATVGGWVGGICGGLIGLIWPILVLCFMNIASYRDEIERWSTPMSPFGSSLE